MTENSTPPKKSLKRRLQFLLDDTMIVLEIIYFFIFIFFFLFLLLELKRYYSIDLIPGYDSPIDDLYGAMKGIISEFLKKLFGENIRISGR